MTVYSLNFKRFVRGISVDVIGNVWLYNADQSVGSSLNLDCCVAITAIWRNYYQLLTHSYKSITLGTFYECIQLCHRR